MKLLILITLFSFEFCLGSHEAHDLMHPCRLNDWNCIRKIFAANGKCHPVNGPVPDPLIIGVNTIYYPIANLSVVGTNIEVRGLSRARVKSFYVNKITNNLVFAIDIPNFDEYIPRAYFRYQREAKEPIVLEDFLTATFPLMTYTAVIPMVPDLRLDMADIYANFPINPPLIAGPGAYASRDPQVIKSIAAINSNLETALREGMLLQAQFLTSTYIQKNICDFGLKLIST